MKKTLRKLLLCSIIGTTLTTSIAFSQDCNYEKNAMDKTTGKLIKLTKMKTVCDNPAVSAGKMSTQKNGDDCSVNWKYDRGFNNTKFVVNKGSELIFVLDDATIINLKRGEEKDNYPITKEQMESMLKSKVTIIKYFYTVIKNDTYDKETYTPSAKEGSKIQDLIKCIY